MTGARLTYEPKPHFDFNFFEHLVWSDRILFTFCNTPKRVTIGISFLWLIFIMQYLFKVIEHNMGIVPRPDQAYNKSLIISLITLVDYHVFHKVVLYSLESVRPRSKEVHIM